MYLCNQVTGQVPADIHLSMMLLFQIYDKFSANRLREKYDDVATMPYNIDEPIDVMFYAVDNLREISNQPPDHAPFSKW